jgi:hypothetical protein
MRRGTKILIAVVSVIAVGGLVLAALPAIGLGIAASTAEKPPEVLLDTNAFEQKTSRDFAAAFPEGSAEQELLGWLRDQDFEIIPDRNTATRTYTGVPCTRTYRVTWVSETGLLTAAAEAELVQLGCL